MKVYRRIHDFVTLRLFGYTTMWDSEPWDPRFSELAQYNSDRYRGVLFDEVTRERMAVAQSDFDEREARSG